MYIAPTTRNKFTNATPLSCDKNPHFVIELDHDNANTMY